MRSTSMSSPSPGAVGRSIQPSSTFSPGEPISSQALFRLMKHSAIRKFGITAEKCTVAASPTMVLL